MIWFSKRGIFCFHVCEARSNTCGLGVRLANAWANSGLERTRELSLFFLELTHVLCESTSMAYRQMAWGKKPSSTFRARGYWIGILCMSHCNYPPWGWGHIIWASHFIKIVRVFLKHEKRDLEIIWKSSLTRRTCKNWCDKNLLTCTGSQPHHVSFQTRGSCLKLNW